MKNRNIPSDNELPSKGKLIKSTILAAVIATVILITIVLPAEYGIDPTGFGAIIGLAKMGEIKVSLAEEAALELSAEPNVSERSVDAVDQEATKSETLSNTAPDTRSDKITVMLEPGEGKEVKLVMAKDAKVEFAWYTDGGEVNFDSHADSKPLQIKYHNYEKGKLERSEGILEAAFDGSHGWFWRNRTSATVSVTLEVNGHYTDVMQF